MNQTPRVLLHPWLPPLIAGGLLVATFVATVFTFAQLDERRLERFELQSNALRMEIGARVEKTRNLLHGATGLFSANTGDRSVTPEDFKRFHSRLIPNNSNRTILYAAYAPKVSGELKSLYETTSRTTIDLGVELRPEGERPVHFPITYVHPVTQSTRATVGFDLYNDPQRRSAILRTIESGAVSVASNVSRIDTNTSVTVFYLATYAVDEPESVEQRRSSVNGLMTVAMVTNRLFGALQFDQVRDQAAYAVDDLTLSPTSPTSLYKTAGFDELWADAQYRSDELLAVGPLQWRVRVAPGESYIVPVQSQLPMAIAIIGTAISAAAWFALRRIQAGRREVEESAGLLSASDRRLQMANNQLQLIARSSPVATVEWDQHGVILQWSLRAESLFMVPASKAIGQTFESLNIMVEEDLAEFRRARNQLLAGVDTNSFAVRCHREDGSTIHTAWFNGAVRDADGLLLSFLSSILDETARHEAEQEILQASQQLEDRVVARTEELQEMNIRLRTEIADRHKKEVLLRESEHRFKTILQCSPIGVCLVSPDGELMDTNQAFEQMVSRVGSPEDKMHIYDFLSESDALSFREDMKLLAEGTANTLQRRMTISGNGGIVTYVSVSITHISEGVDSEYYVVHLVDETAQHRAQQELDNTNNTLQKLVDQLQEKNWRIQTMRDMADRLQLCTSFNEARDTIRAYAEKWFENIGGAISLYNESMQILEVSLSWNEQAGGTMADHFVPGQCWALRRARAHFQNSCEDGLCCEHFQDDREFESLCLPLSAEGQTLGVLHLHVALSEESTIRIDRERADSFAEPLALILANLLLREKLHIQSVRDALTGLFNRRYLEESLDREIKRSDRTGRSLCVFILDLDHFKSYNDRYGHDAGDAVLRHLADLLSTSTRGEDIACRFGGEEFVVILPEATLADAASKAEELRRNVEKLSITFHGQVLGQFTMSAGVAEYPLHGANRLALLRAADQALYQAKHSGRNKVVTAEHAASEEPAPPVV